MHSNQIRLLRKKKCACNIFSFFFFFFYANHHMPRGLPMSEQSQQVPQTDQQRISSSTEISNHSQARRVWYQPFGPTNYNSPRGQVWSLHRRQMAALSTLLSKIFIFPKKKKRDFIINIIIRVSIYNTIFNLNHNYFHKNEFIITIVTLANDILKQRKYTLS